MISQTEFIPAINTHRVDMSTSYVLNSKHYSCRSTNYDRRMGSMAERLRFAREKAGLRSASAAAAAVGINPSTYRAHENGQNEFDIAQAKVYARRFAVDAAWLLTGDEGADRQSIASAEPVPTQADQPAPVYRREPPNAGPPVPVDYPGTRLPIYGQAVAGEDGRFVLNGQRIIDILCPPQLVGVPDAYGVFVHGDSMEPRYEAGEAVFVNPHVPVRRGNYVVAQIAGDDEADDIGGFVKRFISLNSRELVLEQFKPLEGIPDGAPDVDRFTMRFPRSKVVAVHKIVGSADG